MRDLGRAAPDQLLARAPEHPAQRVVDLEPAPVGAEQSPCRSASRRSRARSAGRCARRRSTSWRDEQADRSPPATTRSSAGIASARAGLDRPSSANPRIEPRRARRSRTPVATRPTRTRTARARGTTARSRSPSRRSPAARPRSARPPRPPRPRGGAARRVEATGQQQDRDAASRDDEPDGHSCAPLGMRQRDPDQHHAEPPAMQPPDRAGPCAPSRPTATAWAEHIPRRRARQV